MSGLAGAIIGSSLLGAGGSLAAGGKGASAAQSAASVQSKAAQEALQLQAAMFQNYQGRLAPWMGTGVNALNMLAGLTGTAIGAGGNAIGPGPLQSPLTAPLGTTFQASNVPYSSLTGTNVAQGGNTMGVTFNPQGIGLSWQPTMAQLQQTPGYQWSLDQGLQATQNSFAAQGLGSSGAALKGAANYAEGLAGTTYQNQFQNWLNQLNSQYNIFQGNTAQQYGIWQGQNQLALGQNQQIYNMLGGLAGTGQNAAVNLGTAGLSAAGMGANLLTSGAASQAAGIMGSTNALIGATTGATGTLGSGLTNSFLLPALLQGYGATPNSSSSVNPLAYTGVGYNPLGANSGIYAGVPSDYSLAGGP